MENSRISDLAERLLELEVEKKELEVKEKSLKLRLQEQEMSEEKLREERHRRMAKEDERAGWVIVWSSGLR